MYDYIKGIFTYKNASSKGYFVTIEAGNVGYCFEVTEKDFYQFKNENEEIKIYTVLIHKEDKMSFCGFLKREYRDMFNVLTSVSGVGSKMALTLLNSFLIADLVNFVIDGNFKALTNAKGVGPKLAQKIILELKGKLDSSKNVDLKTTTTLISDFDRQNVEDAQMVLMSLGYDNNEINSALEHALKSLNSSSTAEEILKKSLQILSV